MLKLFFLSDSTSRGDLTSQEEWHYKLATISHPRIYKIIPGLIIKYIAFSTLLL